MIWLDNDTYFSPQYGWHSNKTPAENARFKEVSDTYHDAWMSARNGTDGNGSVDANVTQIQGRLDL
jgi:hypothetical protein